MMVSTMYVDRNDGNDGDDNNEVCNKCDDNKTIVEG